MTSGTRPHRAVALHDLMVLELAIASAQPNRPQQRRSDAQSQTRRARSFESQAFRASGLNLVVSAIVHWNTVYLDRAVTQLKRAERNIPDPLLKHISPLSWEQINLAGIYTWHSEQHLPEDVRSLRLPAGLRRAA